MNFSACSTVISLDEIRQGFRGRIALDEPLAKYTTFRIGGNADLFLEPADREDALWIVRYLNGASIPWRLLGNGSNVLISDHGVRGAVVNLESGFSYVRQETDGTVTAGAGVRLAKFVDFCIGHRLAGTEMLAGIPGTLGGAVIMNAGAYGGEISDHMLDVEIVREGELVRVSRDRAEFAYRTSGLQDDVVLEATFKLPEGDPDHLKSVRRETLLKRNQSQPVQLPNAGSIFKNPPGHYAARLIQDCGLKGYRIGDAQISELHANFIVNLGNASAHDVMSLAEIARSAVRTQFGIDLELEVKVI